MHGAPNEQESEARPWYLGGARPLGARGTCVGVAVVAALALALWMFGYHRSFNGLWFLDALDYGQMARQIADGEGHTSKHGFPYVLAWLESEGRATEPPWPNVTRFVLPAMLRGVLFSVFGTTDFAALIPNLVFFVAGAALVFLLAQQLFGPLAGAAAAALVMTAETQLYYALGGLTETGGAFFIVAVAFVVQRFCANNGAWPKLIALGLTLGLAYLHRSNLAFLAIASAVLVLASPVRLTGRRAWFTLAAVAGLTLLVALPWMIRNAVDFGSPLFSLQTHRLPAWGFTGSDPFNGLKLYEPGQVIGENTAQIVANLKGAWVAEHWHRMFGKEFPWLGIAFLLAGLVPLGRLGRANWLFTLVALLLNYALLSMLWTAERYYHPYAPLMLVSVVGAVVQLARRLPDAASASLLGAGVVAVGLASFGWAADPENITGRRSEPGMALEEAVRQNVPEGSVVASNRSAEICWHVGRTSVRFVGNAEQLAIIDAKYVRIDAVAMGGPTAQRFRQTLGKSALRREFRRVWRGEGGMTLWVRRE